MVKVENRIVQNKLTYKGEVILKYKIEFPQIRGNERFNMYNYNNALRLQQLCEKELYEQAKKVYDYNQENRYPLMIFEIIKEYVVTYNYNNIISIYSDEYIFEGGAHGNTLRYSQNWNLQQGRMIELSELYKRNPNYVSEILKEINNQIKDNIQKEKNTYFEDPCCLTSAMFRVENYYLYGEFIAIFYQQYDIAPYSSGIQVFYMPKRKNS